MTAPRFFYTQSHSAQTVAIRTAPRPAAKPTVPPAAKPARISFPPVNNIRSAMIVLVGATAGEEDLVANDMNKLGFQMKRVETSQAASSRESCVDHVQQVLNHRIGVVERTSTFVIEPINQTAPMTKEILDWPRLRIDPLRYEVFVDDQLVILSKSEFNLLYLLASQPGRVFNRDEIVSNCKGDDYPVTKRSVDVQVVGLRRKLVALSAWIQTVRGVGYRFEMEE